MFFSQSQDVSQVAPVHANNGETGAPQHNNARVEQSTSSHEPYRHFHSVPPPQPCFFGFYGGSSQPLHFSNPTVVLPEQMTNPHLGQSTATHCSSERSSTTPHPASSQPAPLPANMPTNVEPQPTTQGIPKLRSASDAVKTSKIDVNVVPKGFPQGPICGSRDDLKQRLNEHTTSAKTGDGAFSLTFSSEARAAKNRGDRQRLVCSAHKKKGCHFYVVFELTIEG